MLNKDTIKYFPSLSDIQKAADILKGIATHTPLQKHQNTSREYQANIWFKREDLQVVRSYKIRGAYHKMATLPLEQIRQGVCCASAGNHAQGVAFSCQQLEVKGHIFMPQPTPAQKISQVKMFGGDRIDIHLIGDTFDDAYQAAIAYSKQHSLVFIPPFDDAKIIEGQATVGLEILADANFEIDYLFLPVGGGGLAAGVSSLFHYLSPSTKIIGVEPTGAPSLSISLANNKITSLGEIDKFVDGAAVKRVGELNFEICKNTLADVLLVEEGKVCDTLLNMYSKDAIVAEPAGALSVAALEQYKEHLQGKNVVCILSGSNNDITRMNEIQERALIYKKLKHYFIIRFPQRPGALKEFVNDILGEYDDITYFEYLKKNAREVGSAIVGIQLKNSADYAPLIQRLGDHSIHFQYLNDNPTLLNLLV